MQQIGLMTYFCLSKGLVMSIFIVTFAFTLAISSKWAYSYFGLSSFEQIVYHIKVPLEGTNTQFILGG